MRDADVTGDCLSGLPRRFAARNDGGRNFAVVNPPLGSAAVARKAAEKAGRVV
jgi:hypothetical protein